MRFVRVLTVVLTLTALCLSAYAQGDRSGQGERPAWGDGPPRRDRARQIQRPSPEKAEAAWKLEARGLARGLALSGDAASPLVSAYVKSRHAVQEGLEKLRPPRGEDRPPRGEGAQGGDVQTDRPRPERGRPDDAGRATGRARGEFQEKRNEFLAAEKKKLRSDLAGILAGAQLDYAVDVLGTFSDTWDVMVDAIAGFNLAEEKKWQALKPIEAYIAQTAKLGRAQGDARRSGMEVRAEARRKLMEATEDILDDKQLAAFQRAVPGGRTRGQGMSGMLARFDENGDGRIERSELPEPMQQMFDRLDANGDGVLDEEELSAADRGRRGGGQRGRGGDNP